MLKVIRAFSDPFDFDGVFLSVRSHAPPAEHADQFGFNEPVVKEFQRRYGRNILQTSFNLEFMADLCVSEEERQAVYRFKDDLDMGTLQIARTLRAPYHLIEFLLHERKRLRLWEEQQEREWERKEAIEQILAQTGVL